MASRKVESKDFEGKTVAVGGVDSTSVNMIRLSFTDGTTLELWAEDAICTSIGSIPGIFIDDPNIKD